MKKTDWFSLWFNTPYYHILYKNRNDDEAQYFMRNITSHLEITKNSHIADLPCGKGRHSIYLNSLGYKVTGGDLSTNSIEYAKQFETPTLSFEVWDMRKPLECKYDAIFNLFTSFGYFSDDSEDIKVLKNIKNGLKENGVFVLDFLNVEKTKKHLVESETKIVDSIKFQLRREIVDGFIQKHISFTDQGVTHNYTEKVKFLNLEKMKLLFERANLKIIDTFGDYSLNRFNKETSNRLIIIAQ